MLWTYISYAVGAILAVCGTLILLNVVAIALPTESRMIFGAVIMLYGVYRIVSTQKSSIDNKR